MTSWAAAQVVTKSKRHKVRRVLVFMGQDCIKGIEVKSNRRTQFKIGTWGSCSESREADDEASDIECSGEKDASLERGADEQM
jgi:hypothetical protein